MKTTLKSRAMALLLTLALLCSLLVLPAGAASTVASGNTGSLTWTLTDDGVLTIAGSGAMPDSYNPWAKYSSQVK